MSRSLGLRFIHSIQQQCLYAITGAYKKTSLASLCVSAGLLPLEMQLEIGSTIGRVLRLGISVEEYDSKMFQPKLNKHQIIPYVSSVSQLSKEEAEIYGKDLEIYTDGSRTDTGTGYAFCVYKNNLEIYTKKIKLQDGNTVYQAELLAIRDSIVWCKQTGYKVFIIYTDSLSGLQALQDHNSTDYIIIEIIKELQSTNKIFHIVWIKGHTGIVGNERADILAKEATEMKDETETKFHPLPASYLKRKLKLTYLKKWQDQWDTETKSRYTYKLLPKVSEQQLLKHRNLYLFITNHGPFGSYLGLFKPDISRFCICGGIADSLHYILDCPLTVRFHLRKPDNISFSNWLNLVLKNSSSIQKIISCVDYVGQHLFEFQGVIQNNALDDL